MEAQFTITLDDEAADNITIASLQRARDCILKDIARASAIKGKMHERINVSDNARALAACEEMLIYFGGMGIIAELDSQEFAESS